MIVRVRHLGACLRHSRFAAQPEAGARLASAYDDDMRTHGVPSAAPGESLHVCTLYILHDSTTESRSSRLHKNCSNFNILSPLAGDVAGICAAADFHISLCFLPTPVSGEEICAAHSRPTPFGVSARMTPLQIWQPDILSYHIILSLSPLAGGALTMLKPIFRADIL